MFEEQIKKWQESFDAFLDRTHPDIKELFNEHILYTPDKNNQIHPQIFQLKKAYATKEQIQKMNEVFDDYLKNNSI